MMGERRVMQEAVLRPALSSMSTTVIYRARSIRFVDLSGLNAHLGPYCRRQAASIDRR